MEPLTNRVLKRDLNYQLIRQTVAFGLIFMLAALWTDLFK